MNFMATAKLTRRSFFVSSAAVVAGTACSVAATRPPNVVLINCDDLGYGDLGCYGSAIQTPNINRLAAEGMRFTNAYSASPVCSPSRAALLTGRYPTRVGVPEVLFPDSTTGLSESEVTIAGVLKNRNYRTACIGKWHLGSQPRYLPTNRGFDFYFGIPYSNDMNPRVLMRNTTVIENPARLETLTERYTEQAVRFIDQAKDAPFFLYFAHTYPHIPLAASHRFRGRSKEGLYGDVVEEIDWSLGEVTNALRKHSLERDTLVMFTSDNGPWYQGSPGGLRGRKNSTYEGGLRVPFIAWFPGRIPHGITCHSVVSHMDVLPTLAGLCSARRPPNPLDGVDIGPVLTGSGQQVHRDVLLFFDFWNVQCARLGRWKLHLARYDAPPYAPQPPGGKRNLPLRPVELYDLETDPDESYDVAPENPRIVTDILSRVERLIPTFPELVQKAYVETKAQQTLPVPVGALPRRRKE
jgi:arylsulfatase